MKKVPFNNRVRYFDVKISPSMVHNLARLQQTELYGDYLSTVAHTVIDEWIGEWEELGRFSFLGLTIESAIDAGYPIGDSVRSPPRDLYKEAMGKLRLGFGGIELYVLENLGRVEPDEERKNPFYQKTPQQIIGKILNQQVPCTVRKLIQEGLAE